MDEEADAQQKALSGQMFTAVPGEGSVKNFQYCMAGVWQGGAGFSTNVGCSKGLILLFLLLLGLQEFKCRDLDLTDCLSQLPAGIVG